MNQIVLTLTEFKKHKASTYHSIRPPSVAVVQAHRPILLHTSTSIVCSCCRQSSPIPTEGTSPTFLSTRHGLGDLPASHGGPPPPARTSLCRALFRCRRRSTSSRSIIPSHCSCRVDLIQKLCSSAETGAASGQRYGRGGGWVEIDNSGG